MAWKDGGDISGRANSRLVRSPIVVAAACLYLSRAQPAHLYLRYTVTKIIHSLGSGIYELQVCHESANSQRF